MSKNKVTKYSWGRSMLSTKFNKPMAIVSVSVLTVCLLLLGTFVLVSMNISSYLNRLGEANVVRVYPPYTATQSEVYDLKTALEAADNVATVTYVPKEEGAEEFKQSYSEYGDILDGFEANPLPDKFVITLKDMTRTSETISVLQSIEGVEKVTWSASATRTIVTIKRVLEIAGGAVVIILAIISAFIISNTIRASMQNRSLEIGIMRLVGAKNSFIRKPFIIEGFLIGVIGSVIAYVIEYFIYVYGMQKLIGSIELLKPMPFKEIALPLAGSFLLVGVLTGVLGSVISVRKHLKV
ncbi:MAG: permease-like cell division protein FtsX [Clostridia bacterium]|nr:permease-like cell division protein FtsX [Clostridia bacterium]